MVQLLFRFHVQSVSVGKYYKSQELEPKCIKCVSEEVLSQNRFLHSLNPNPRNHGLGISRNESSILHSVADPGFEFSQRICQLQKMGTKSYYSANFPPKLPENERNWSQIWHASLVALQCRSPLTVRSHQKRTKLSR